MPSKKRHKSRKVAATPSEPAHSDAQIIRPPSTLGMDSGWNWKDAAILAPILILGLILRVLYLQEILSAPDFAFPVMDAAYKDAWAKSMLTGRWPIESGQPDPGLSTSPYLRPPGYSLFLAAVYLLTGTSYLAVRLVQMALGLASAVLMYTLGRALFGRAIGAVGAAFMVTYWILIFFEGELSEPSLIVFILLAMINLMRLWPHMPESRHFLWPGVCLGMLILLRPETGLLAPFLLLWGWWVTRGKASTGRRAAQLALFTAATAALILPVTARNYIVSGEFVPICTIGGLNLYAGNNPDANGSFPNLDYSELFGVSTTLSHHNFQELLFAHRRNTGNPELGHADLERFFVSEALAYMRENPGHILQLAMRKVLLFWGPWEVTSNKVLYFEREHSRFLSWLPGFPLVAGLAWAGFALWVRNARRHSLSGETKQAGVLIAAIVAISCLTHILFFVVGRFRVPVIPLLILFAAYALVSTYLMARAGQWKQVGIWGSIAAALVIFFHIPLVSYEYERDRWHYMRGMSYGVTGDLESAIKELQLAVDAGGREYWLLSEMGFARSIQGEFALAADWFERALEVQPDDSMTLNRYGYALLQLDRLDEAEATFRTALEYDFTQFEARYNLALMLMRSNQLEEAEAEFRQLLEIHPNQVNALFDFGLLLAAKGDSAGAQEMFRRAVAITPSHANAWNYLGMELASQGDLEGAQEAYRTALAADAGNLLVHINLGNLYAHQGRYEDAAVHYMQVRARDMGESDPDQEELRPPDDHDALALQGLGFALAQQGNRDEAISRFQQSLDINPNNPVAHNALGYELMERGNMEQARHHFEQAIAQDPNMILARNNLGDLFVRTGRPGEARTQYEAVLGIAPANEYAQRALARIEERLGGREEIQGTSGNILLF